MVGSGNNSFAVDSAKDQGQTLNRLAKQPMMSYPRANTDFILLAG